MEINAKTSLSDVRQVAFEVAGFLASRFGGSDSVGVISRYAASQQITVSTASSLHANRANVPGAQALYILSNALYTVAHCTPDAVTSAAVELSLYFGFTDSESLAIGSLFLSLQPSVPMNPVDAINLYFEPTDEMKLLAQRLALRLDLRRDRIPVAAIAPRTYEHPDDAAALQTLRTGFGVETALRKVSEFRYERMMRAESYAGKIRVSPLQFPDLHNLFLEAVEMLGVERVPELFLESGQLDGHTMGVDAPLVYLSQRVPIIFNREELLFIIGHELGHIRSGHAPFTLLRTHLPWIIEFIGPLTLGLGTVLGYGVNAVLEDWYRKSELTADRCGLLLCQNSDAALSALMKLAGAPFNWTPNFNFDAFLAQADHYDALYPEGFSSLQKRLAAYFEQGNHPWLALRARALLAWINSGAYEALLQSQSGPRCGTCGALRGTDPFCGNCGTRFP
jgi:Zn-dependent protease with chaperone function